MGIDAKPIPLEGKTFEHWAPLRFKGDREDPNFTDPMAPARTRLLAPNGD